jgi:hypothetical protein
MSRSILRSVCAGLLGCGFLGVSLGCGGSAATQVTVVPAKGKVTVKGQPGANLVLSFIPKQGTPVRPTAITTSDGSFEVHTYKSGDGGPEGEYKVAVTVQVDPTLSESKKEEMAAQLAADARKIPAPYQKAETTPLTVKIEKGKPDLGVLEIK